MRGITGIKILIVIIIFALGWTCGQVLKDISIFTLDLSINVSDVLAILIEIGLAVFIAMLVEKGMQNQRVEKDFFITELNEAQKAYSDLSKECSRLTPLSLKQTIYQIEKPKRDLLKMWETMEIRNNSLYNNKKKDFDLLIEQIKTLNGQLSDSSYFLSEKGCDPVSIKNNVIHLNNSVTKRIDETFDSIKDSIFKLKLAINDM